MASDLNRTLSDAFTGIALGATDQVTGRDNLGQFLRGMERKQEKREAKERNQSLLQSDIALGFIDESDLDAIGGRSTLESQNAEVFAENRASLRTLHAERKGEKDTLEDARQRIVAKGIATPDEVSEMDMDALSEAEGIYQRAEIARTRANENISQELEATQGLIQTLTDAGSVTTDSVTTATLALEETKRSILENPNISEETRTSYMSTVNVLGAQILGIESRAQAQDIGATLTQDLGTGLSQYSSNDNPRVRADVENTQAFRDAETNVTEAMTFAELDSDTLEELDTEPRAALDRLLGDDPAALAGQSAKSFMFSSPEEAARIAQFPDMQLLREGVEDARLRIEKLRPVQTQIKQAIDDITTTNSAAAALLGLEDFDVDNLTLDASGTIQGRSNVLTNAQLRMSLPEAAGGYGLEDLIVLFEAGQLGAYDAFNPDFQKSLEATIRQRQSMMSPTSVDAARQEAQDTVFDSALAGLGNAVSKHQRDTQLHGEGVENIETSINRASANPFSAMVRRAAFDFPDEPQFTYTSPELQTSIFGNAGAAASAQVKIDEIDARLRNPSTEDSFRLEDLQAERLIWERNKLKAKTRQLTRSFLSEVVDILGQEGKPDPAAIISLVEDFRKDQKAFGSVPGLETYSKNAGTEATPAQFLEATITFLNTNAGEIFGAETRSPDDIEIMRATLLDQLAEFQELHNSLGRYVERSGLSASDFGPDFSEKNLISELARHVLEVD